MAVVSDFTALLFENDAFRWNGARDLGAPVIVTYSFADRAAELPSEADFPDRSIGDFTTGFGDAGQQQIARDALAVFAATAGVRFVEVETGGMIHFVEATSVESNGFQVSFANIPAVSASFGSLGVAVMNQFHFPLDPGGSGFTILLHEIAHGLGLDHSDAGDNTLDPALDVVANTIMQSVGGDAVTDIGAFDKQALQFLYGAVDAFNFDQLAIANDTANGEIDIDGTTGADKFVTPNFRSNVAAGGGADIVFGNEPDDRIDGGDGDDHLIGGGGDDVLIGGDGADTLDGLGFLQGNFLGGADRLFGGDGDDVLIDRFDTTIFDGGAGDDTLDASTRSQTVIEFTDTAKFISIEHVILSAGDDFFRGVGADDDVQGGAGDDTLLGGDGDDVLDGGAGADRMQGAVGDDTYVIDDAGDEIFETSGTDRVIAEIAFTLPDVIENGTATGAAQLTGNSTANMLDGDADANRLAGVGGDDVLIGGGGDDILIGGAGADTLNGDAGVDRLVGGSGADAMSGGAGNDIYDVENAGDTVTEAAGQGVDRINVFIDYVNAANVEFLIGKFAAVGLTLTGNGGRDRITGANKIGSGDTLFGEGGNDKLVGLVGDDVVNGGVGNDRVFGNSGDDVINGGPGNDRVTGQQNADRFVLDVGGGRDRVTDFDVTEDLLDLTAFEFANAAAALAVASDVNGNVEFDLPGADAVILEGVAKAALGTEDILI